MSNVLKLSTTKPELEYVLPLVVGGQSVQVGHKPPTYVPLNILNANWEVIVGSVSPADLTWELTSQELDVKLYLQTSDKPAPLQEAISDEPEDISVEIESGGIEELVKEVEAEELESAESEEIDEVLVDTVEVPTVEDIQSARAGRVREMAEQFNVEYTNAHETREALITELHGGHSDAAD